MRDWGYRHLVPSGTFEARCTRTIGESGARRTQVCFPAAVSQDILQGVEPGG